MKQVVCTRRGLDEDREVFIARACRFTLRASSAGGICARKLDGTVILCVDAQAGAEVDLVVPYPPAGSGELQGEIVGASAADIPPGAILPINAATGATASDPAVRFILLDVGVPEFIRAVLEGVGS